MFKLTKLYDGIFLKWIGTAILKPDHRYTWTPRYDHNGDIYAWIRDERDIKNT